MSAASTFTPITKIPDIHATPLATPILKVNSQSLTALASSRVGTMPTTTPLLTKASFANLRAASTLIPSKSSLPGNVSPQTSLSNLSCQSISSNPSTPQPSHNLLSSTKPRHIHNSKPLDTMLSDNVHLPTFTAEARIEIPRVPILPTTQRAPARIEIETQVEPSIITAAGSYTHPAPTGRGSDRTIEYLQRDSTKPRSETKESEMQSGKDSYGESQQDPFKFVPEEGEIPANERGILWGLVGAATLWGLFGPGKKNK